MLSVEDQNHLRNVPSRYKYDPVEITQGELISTTRQGKLYRYSLDEKVSCQPIEAAGLELDRFDVAAAVKELDMLLKNEHRCIIQAVGISVDGAQRRIVLLTELTTGTLQSLMEEDAGQKLYDNPLLSCKLVLNIIAALRWIHAKPPVDGKPSLHLSLHPSRIAIVDHRAANDGIEYAAKLLDIGQPVSDVAAAVTQKGGNLASDSVYQPAEQFEETGRPTPATDVYAVCVMLWQIICKKKAFAGKSAVAICRAVLASERSLEDLPASEHEVWSASLCQMVTNGLSKEASRRPSLEQLKEEVEYLIEELTATPPTFEPVALPRKYKCDACEQPLEEAIKLQCCAHKICGHCSRRCQSQGVSCCPTCFEGPANYSRDPYITEVVRKWFRQPAIVRCHKCMVSVFANRKDEHKCPRKRR